MSVGDVLRGAPDPCLAFGMIGPSVRKMFRQCAVFMAVVLALGTVLPAALAVARLAERIELAALGLSDVVNCHAGLSGAGQPSSKIPGRTPSHETSEIWPPLELPP